MSLAADVLILGGGSAGTWAAVSAAAAGATVVLADKGYCGTSGAAASGGNNLWFIPPDDPETRDASIRAREAASGYLTNRRWMERVLDVTCQQVNRLAEWGYPFPEDKHCRQRRSSLQGPEYLRRMRRQVLTSGVRILDHHPALELLTILDARVAGAAGLRRQRGWEPWRVEAGAVVLATGGSAFLSGALGLNVDTGDGPLMAAEVGADMSGMEFSCHYAMAPAFGTETKGLMYQFATYTYEDGTVVDEAGGLPSRQFIAGLLADRPVYARLDQAPRTIRDAARHSQPNFFLPFDKAGIDPFEERFPVRMVLEGTVRGTGGLRLADDLCATAVPGLFAAGDVASREAVTGGISGGGSHNAAWAISSGTWAGGHAAAFAMGGGSPRSGGILQARGRAGLRPSMPSGTFDAREVVTRVQAEVLPLERNFVRHGETLAKSLDELDLLWEEVAARGGGQESASLRSRQAAAMVAHARWMYRSALARPESRAMHQRTDFPAADPALAHHVVTGGLDRVWTARQPLEPGQSLAAGASRAHERVA